MDHTMEKLRDSTVHWEQGCQEIRDIMEWEAGKSAQTQQVMKESPSSRSTLSTMEQTTRSEDG